MKISFFEEFPSSVVLKKAEKINFPFNLYLADYSIDSFKLYKKEIKNKHLKKCIWWPLLPKEAGYWVSGFTRTSALKKLFSELQKEKIPVMLDLEYPKKRLLLIKNFFKRETNIKLIHNFIENYKGEIYCCEYYKDFGFIENKSGLHFDNAHKIIKMYYTSMHHFSDKSLEKNFKKNITKYQNKFLVALGIIAVGILGNEKILSHHQLKRDLELCKKAGINEVIIYRLEGLNEEYLKVLEKFSD